MFVRVRPPDPGSDASKDMCIDVDNTRNAIIIHAKPEPKQFTYDQVADIYATQVYKARTKYNEIILKNHEKYLKLIKLYLLQEVTQNYIFIKILK